MIRSAGGKLNRRFMFDRDLTELGPPTSAPVQPYPFDNDRQPGGKHATTLILLISTGTGPSIIYTSMS